MKLVFSDRAWQDYLYWQENGPAMLARVNELIKEALRTPSAGIGKPEPLVGNLMGWRSRRITREHRLVYQVSGSGSEQKLEITSCRFHYDR